MRRHAGRAKITLKQKLTLFLLLLAIVPTGIISMVSLRQTEWAGSELSRRSLRTSTQSMSSHLANSFSYISGVLDAGESAESFIFLMDVGDAEKMKQYTMRLLLSFINAIEVNPYGEYIQDVCVISARGAAMSAHRGLFALEDDFGGYGMVQSMLDEPDAEHVFAPARPMYTYNTRGEVITFARLIRHHEEVIGLISVDVDITLVAAVFEKTWDSDYAALVNGQGETIVGSHDGTFQSLLAANIDRMRADSEETGSFAVGWRGESYYLSYSDYGINDWRVVTVNRSSAMDRPLESIRLAILIAGMASLLIGIFLVLFVTIRYFRPITDLQALMAKAQQNSFDLDVRYSGDYEIERLYADFNALLKQTRAYMQRIVAEQDNLKAAEMRTLQAQINPHFLYNTLDIAVHVAETKQTDKVINLLLALSRYYRIVLSGGMNDISLADEVENTRIYLSIMKMHYQDMIDYRVETEGDLALCPRFPKLTLQPIVENAIVHGLDPQEHGGTVAISVRVDGEGRTLTIEISDNGIGMTPEELSDLWELVDHREGLRSGRSFGLSNIKKRLDIFFRGDYAFQVDSRPYAGTTVRIEAPLRAGEGGDGRV